MKRFRFRFIVKVWLLANGTDYRTLKIEGYGTSKHDALFNVMKQIDLDMIKFYLDDSKIVSYDLTSMLQIEKVNA